MGSLFLIGALENY